MVTPPLSLRVFDAFSKIESLFRAAGGVDDAPFLRPEFLSALETTACVAPDTGWIPHHLALYEGDRPIAVAPAYLKLHSMGEFVFDHGWASAAKRLGVAYYPKLVVASPFTPATAPRVLSMPGVDPEHAREAFVAGVVAILNETRIGSAHVLFSSPDEASSLAGQGLIERHGVQFHFQNRGYASYEAFLATLPSKRRTQLRRERRAPSEQGLVIETLTGAAITPEVVDVMFDFYLATVEKFSWGRQYLTRGFFEQIASTMSDAIEVVVARRTSDRAIVAGAFNLRGRRTLFGRYWGTRVDLPFLHFNVCYYHSVERAITLGLERFEPGAGGEHKLARGFDPVVTHSTHVIGDPRLRRAVAEFCEQERSAIAVELGCRTASS